MRSWGRAVVLAAGSALSLIGCVAGDLELEADPAGDGWLWRDAAPLDGEVDPRDAAAHAAPVIAPADPPGGDPLPPPNPAIDPDDGLRLELTWQTPGDMDLDDARRADLDLYLRHPRARAWDEPLTCSRRHPSPDWGEAGFDEDDPTAWLSADGAEHITLPKPEITTDLPGGGYLIGVHAARLDAKDGTELGPSWPTVRVYIGGKLEFEAVQKLGMTGDFWVVAGLHWHDAPRIEVLDRLTHWP